MGIRSMLGAIRSILTRTASNGRVLPQYKVEVFPGDLRYVTMYGPAGDDSRALPSDMALCVPGARPADLKCVGVLDTVNAPQAAKGERRIYSRDASGNIVATIWLKATGDIIITGDVTLTGNLDITGDVTVTGNVDMAGDLAVDGNIDATGTITGDTDVVSGLISLRNHTHMEHDWTPTTPYVTGPPQ